MFTPFRQYLGLYVVLILAALPLVFGWVPPNRWYGFRLTGAGLDPSHWYAINALGGKIFIAAMFLCLAANALILWKGTPAIRSNLGWINAALIFLSFWLVTLELLDRLP